MSSDFSQRWNKASLLFQKQFGEPVQVTPRIQSERRGFLPDPERMVPVPVVGIFTESSFNQLIGGQRHGTEFQGMLQVAAAPATIWFSAATLDALGFRPQVHDLITLTDRGQSYAIVRPDADDLDDTTFPLVFERP